jgi:putative hydrolase of the HAD superfamily
VDIQAVLFDIGDTLLDATGIQQRALTATVEQLAARHLIPDTEAFLATYGQVDAEMEAIDLNHLYSDMRLIEGTLTALGLVVDNRVTGFFLTRYRDLVRQAIVPDISLIRLFEELAGDGYALGIVSNGTTVEQLEQLVRLGIIQYLDPIVISQQVGLAKPDPQFFDLAAWRLKIARRNMSRILLIGDRPDVDVQGAHMAGMKAGLLIEHVDHQSMIQDALSTPDCILTDLQDLPRVLRSWGAKQT